MAWEYSAERYEFAYGIVSDKLKSHLDRIDKIGTILGAVIGAAAALIALWHPAHASALSVPVCAAFVGSILLAGLGLAARSWSDPPSPASVVNAYRDYYAQTLHSAMTKIAIDYWNNQQQLRRKATMLNFAMVALSLGAATAAAVAYIVPANAG